MITLQLGNKYNWVGQSERLIYLGHNWSGNGYWHQFAKVETPDKIWCEVVTSDLDRFEETAKTRTSRNQAKKQRRKAK